jgi:hypothetical protein
MMFLNIFLTSLHSLLQNKLTEKTSVSDFVNAVPDRKFIREMIGAVFGLSVIIGCLIASGAYA